MEKISIVKRRKKEFWETARELSPGNHRDMEEHELSEVPTSMLQRSASKAEEGMPTPQYEKYIDETISINLTPEQYDLVKSSQYVKYFLKGEANGVTLDVRKHGNGKIVFNFQFRKVNTVKMLKSEHVCRMLQISKSTLIRLVKLKALRSYKIGRIRRFLFQDILDYLSRSEEVFRSSGDSIFKG
ncbi:MAG: helix-turn-helix domain-containing protein [Deltaproteobacteria bacterium]|nr:helix-turn-helix domain-containing protein [Deltaproteobacteria bacterium]